MALSNQEQLLLGHFSKYITDHKKDFIARVLSQRTRHLTIVLEDIYQSHNASAVVRTCECMGLQDIHIIESRSVYEVNKKVLKGSYKWMHLIRYKSKEDDNTEICFKALRDSGYRICVTDPAMEGTSIHDMDILTRKTALVFGNEERGASRYALEHADETIKIPMYGFTESFNISVSVAICLQALIPALRSGEWKFGLSPAEQDELKLNWYRKVVRRADLIEKGFLKSIQ